MERKRLLSRYEQHLVSTALGYTHYLENKNFSDAARRTYAKDTVHVITWLGDSERKDVSKQTVKGLIRPTLEAIEALVAMGIVTKEDLLIWAKEAPELRS